MYRLLCRVCAGAPLLLRIRLLLQLPRSAAREMEGPWGREGHVDADVQVVKEKCLYSYLVKRPCINLFSSLEPPRRSKFKQTFPAHKFENRVPHKHIGFIFPLIIIQNLV